MSFHSIVAELARLRSEQDLRPVSLHDITPAHLIGTTRAPLPVGAAAGPTGAPTGTPGAAEPQADVIGRCGR